MGVFYKQWIARSKDQPNELKDIRKIILNNRRFEPIEDLVYGDYGLEEAYETILKVLRENKKIALYADYDVDGTMSAVSWIWFLKAIGYQNYTLHIPCRFSEGYGVNLKAIQKLVEVDGAQCIITMDTGITANIEAAFCKERGVIFICTDHHKIQKEKMPDSIILNPKMHPHEDYQELCGAGITFVLLRKLAKNFKIAPDVWNDILALVGMATICDLVPLNPVNHRIARLGAKSLMRSQRDILVKLREACMMDGKSADEKDIGFRLGPRINAVGRLDHAQKIVDAFVNESPEELIAFMSTCNERRKTIQKTIESEAESLAAAIDPCAPILFMGGEWHQGVIGIAASRISQNYWRPTWLFDTSNKEVYKGSARSIPGFDVTEAMSSCKDLWLKFGGHQAAGGFSFHPDNFTKIKDALTAFAEQQREIKPETWLSHTSYDCEIDRAFCQTELLDTLNDIKPFGMGFDEPRFRMQVEVCDQRYYNDKITQRPKHTALSFLDGTGCVRRIMFFSHVMPPLSAGDRVDVLVNFGMNHFRGETQLAIYGADYATGTT